VTDRETRLSNLLDRDEIASALVRYCNANDADDWEGMASVFVAEGREARAEAFSRIRERATTLMPIEHIDREQHILSNIEVSVDGDTASSFSAARVYIVGTRGGEPILLMRGITYTDTWVRATDGWKISDRKHHLVWMTETKPIEGAQVT
jgi:hypothetical protein